MNVKVTFPSGQRVDAEYGPFNIITNQDGSAPSPFALFLASIGTCAGIYVLNFCNQRNIPTDGMQIVQKMETNPFTRMIEKISIDIHLPEDFPEKYKNAVMRAADQCAVKRHMMETPDFEINTITLNGNNNS